MLYSDILFTFVIKVYYYAVFNLKISGWLCKIFDGKNYPDFEINCKTVDTLKAIMDVNSEMDNAISVIIDDVKRKTEEYEAKGKIFLRFKHKEKQ